MIGKFIGAHLTLLFELGGVLLFFGLVIVAGGFVISRCDGLSFEESLYFAFITALTVGLGDITPKSRAARVVTVVLAFLGMLLAGILVAVAVHALDMALSAT
jgi:voltage-gated potassium channel